MALARGLSRWSGERQGPNPTGTARVTAETPPVGEPRARSFQAQFEAQQQQTFNWKALVKRLVVVLVAGLALYLVLPELFAVFHSWPRLATLDLLWFIPALLAEVAHFACTFSLQRIALRTKAWFPVITAQLAGNSISLIVPGGAAAGAAVQFRMLAVSGMDATDAVGGLTAFSFLGIGGLLALPVFVLPVVLFGTPVSRGLADAAIVGAIGFFLFVGLGTWVMAADAPLRYAGQVGPVAAQPAAGASGCRSAACPSGSSSSGTSSARSWASSGGRPRCCRPAVSASTTSACSSRCSPWGPTPGRPSSCWPTRWPGSSGWCPITPGGLGHRRGEPQRPAHRRRAGRGPGGAGHPGLPAGLLLAPADVGTVRLRGVQAPLPRFPGAAARGGRGRAHLSCVPVGVTT